MGMYLLVTICYLALASATASTYYHHELPTGWKRLRDASPREKLDLSIELYQPRMAALKTRLATISDPHHADYGRHLKKADLEEYQASDPEGAQTVLSWLKKGGIHDAILEGSSIRFSSCTMTTNRLLNASVGHYGSAGIVHPRATSYSIPSHLESYIHFVHPLSHFAKPVGSRLATNPKRNGHSRSPTSVQRDMVRRKESYISYKQPRQEPGGPEQPCPDGVTPTCLRALLGLPDPKNQTGCRTREPRVRYAVAGFLEQTIHYDDVASFLEKYSPGIQSKGYNFTVQLLNNATNPQTPAEDAGIEASLDLEYAMALGYPSDITYYLSGGRAPSSPTTAPKSPAAPTAAPPAPTATSPSCHSCKPCSASTTTPSPHVLSLSYSDDENTVPPAYAAKVCDLFAQLAARGTTVLVSSGDGGAGGTRPDDDGCLSNDGRFRQMFIPTFPGSCPYVTAVGATGASLPLRGSGASGGGFSDYFARPEWQRGAAGGYLAALNRDRNASDARLYNASGRAIPDLSAPGEGFSVVLGGEEDSNGGTSASVVVVAAMVALVDQERFRRGKSSLGWLNPLLYSPKVRESRALVDVSAGVSHGCQYGNVSVPGFAAYRGYDCVTGLGAVGSFRRLLDALG
ncbi:tripeptidyl-peptidase sed3 [Apiospora marii]|uniref:tripeptidyl-peptidase II n=1 Tax=Apiospora marii TaxID=335849 RepID=A0ABR1RU84_9PEZI